MKTKFDGRGGSMYAFPDTPPSWYQVADDPKWPMFHEKGADDPFRRRSRGEFIVTRSTREQSTREPHEPSWPVPKCRKGMNRTVPQKVMGDDLAATPIYIHTYLPTYPPTYVCTHVCKRIHIYIFFHIQIYTCIYIYTCICRNICK